MPPSLVNDDAPTGFQITAKDRFLIADLGSPCATTSWAILGGGQGIHRHVVWYHLAPHELRVDLDPVRYLRHQIDQLGMQSVVGLLTSRRPGVHHLAEASVDGVHAQAVATVGMSNALRVSDPPGAFAAAGTINILCHVDAPLTESARLEALSLVAEARTTAVLEAALSSRRSGQPATGTGTDCIVISCPLPDERAPLAYAGKHTAVGAAIGRATLQAVGEGVATWRTEFERP